MVSATTHGQFILAQTIWQVSPPLTHTADDSSGLPGSPSCWSPDPCLGIHTSPKAGFLQTHWTHAAWHQYRAPSFAIWTSRASEGARVKTEVSYVCVRPCFWASGGGLIWQSFPKIISASRLDGFGYFGVFRKSGSLRPGCAQGLGFGHTKVFRFSAPNRPCQLGKN